MAQEVVTFGDVVPSQLRVLPLATGAGRVARKVKREYLPVRQGTFSYKVNSEIEFHVSAGKEMLVPSECYLRFKMRVDSKFGSVGDSGTCLTSVGAHALFRKVEISDRAHRQIDVINDYDHVANIISHVYENADHGARNNFSEGQAYLRRNEEDVYTKNHSLIVPGLNGLYIDESIHFGTVNVATNGVVTGTGFPTNDKIVGRQVYFSTTDGIFVISSTIIAVASATSLTIDPAPVAVANGVRMFLLEKPNRVGHLEEREFTMRLKAGLFDSPIDLPLFLMDGLQIKLHLNSDFKPFVQTKLPSQFTRTLEYELFDCRMICNLRTPSAEIRDQYLEMFQKGLLNYPFLSYFTVDRNTSGNTTTSAEFDLPVSKSSIKKVFFVCQTDVERSNIQTGPDVKRSLLTDTYRYIAGGLNEFQFKIGASEYPSLPLRIPDKYAADAFTELLIAANRHRDDSRIMRILPEEWLAVNAAYVDQSVTDKSKFIAEPLKRIYGVRFDTIEDDMLSGVKTRGVGTDDHIVAKLNFQDPGYPLYINDTDANTFISSTRHFLFFFEHSKVLHISKRGILALD